MLENYPLLKKKPHQTIENMNTHLSSGRHLKKFKAQLFFTSILLILVNFSFGQLSLENFNSGIPSGWAVTSNLTVTNNWISNATGGYQATGGASVNPASNNTVGTTAQYFMISPQFLTPENGEIRFFTKQGSFTNRGATYQVRISTANQPDITGFNVVLQSWTETQLNVSATTYEEKIVPIPSLPAGIPVYIAFVAVTNQTGTTATSGDTWFVDNVRVIPECTPITGITTNLTSQTAQINWTHPTATNFSIQVVPNGVGIGSSGTPVSGTSYLASGLTANTTYDAWIRTDCDATTFSSWAGPFIFTTPQVGLNCAAPIIIPSDVSTTPYVLSSNLANYYSTTDYTPYTTVGSNCFPTGTSNQLLGNHIFFNYTPTSTGLIDIRQEVTVISGGGPNACYNGLSSVMVFNSCADVGVSCLAAIRTGTSSSESLISQISNFYVVAGHTYVIVMSSPYDQAQSNASLCFTFTVSGSTCPAPAPSGTTYNNLTQTSADFSWGNVGNLVSAWEYVALPVAFGAPTGSTVLTSTSTNLNNPVSGLTPATDYNLYVRSVCGGIPGPWSTPLPFTTPCNPYTPPYYTGFTNTSETECWSQLNLNNDLNFFDFGNNAFSEPVAKIRAQNSNDMLVSPQFHFDGVTQKRLRFKYNVYGNWGLIVNNPTGGPGSFEIRLSTTGVGPNNFSTVVVPLAEYTTAYNFIEMMVPLPNVIGDVNIAWVLPPGATQTGNWIYIDNVYIEDLPACSEPSYPTVTPGSITTTSATISWTNGYNNTQWELVAQPLGTGTPTAPGIIVNTNPYTLTGLIPSTRYEFYMRAVCSSTEQSVWVGPINFNTLCIAQDTPYYESLNETDVNTKKFCWSVINNSDELTRWRIEATEAQIRAASTMFEPFVNFDDWLVSAPINAVGLKRLRFNHRAVNGIFNPTPRGNVEVLMSSTPDFSTYSVIIPSFDFTNIAYQEKSALFTGTGTTYIAFRVPPTMSDPSNSGIMMIDDVYIDDAPPCPDPTNLAVSNITTSTVNLSWAPGYLETQWQVAIQPAGTGTPTGSGTTVNTTPTYNATGLTPNTLYECYVRANCDANGYSSWVGPIAFKTDCNPIATPFLETFDSTSTTESCWKIVNGNGDGNDWFLNQTVEPIFGDQMAALFTGSNGDNNEWLITPTLTVQPNQRLRFYFKVYDGFFEEDLKVMLSTNGSSINQFTTVLYENSLNAYTDANGVTAGSNTITLDSTQDVRVGDFIYIPDFPFPYPTYVAAVNGTQITMTTSATITQTGVQNVQFEHEVLNNEEPREFIINLTDITAPTNINLAFHTPFFDPNPWAYRGQYTFIDNVIVEDIPVCPSVINVTTSNIIDTSVKINWEPVGTETSWEISVQPYGTPAPVGNTLPQYLTTTSTHPKTITGLTPATQYQYYVRAICSSTSQSEWVGPFEFTTLCDFANLCEYTITTISGNTGQVSQSVNVMQNGVVNQILEFPGFNQTELTYTVFLCSGVAFDLYWDGLGSGVQYSQAQIIIKDASNNVIWTSPLGLGTVNTNIYSGFATCGPITCPEPTNLSVSNQGVFSWTPGASETQWEVFVQPLENGTLPQSGTIVNSPSYTPVAADFVDSSASTYEYFVRAICSATNKSYWSGPKVFIRNDEETTSVHLPVNSGTTCDASGVDVSFIGATASTTPTACEGTNGGDVWFDFVATSKIHTIELSDFTPGSYYASSYEGPWPRIIMSLYEVQTNGSLIEKGCSDNNSFVASYSSELVVGQTYKIRLKLNDVIPNNKKFHICITTPSELCDLDAFNYNFEKLPMQYVTGISTIINALVVPGWRVNTVTGQMFYQEANNSLNVTPYSGGQCIQLIQDGAAAWDPNDPNIKGLYKDFDTSEIPQMDYSFASATRTSSSTVQLYAGPPSGPFTLVTEHTAVSLVWQLVQGTYTVPVGQTTTRFIFRVKDYTIGHLLDAANFKAKVNIDIATAPTTLDCVTTSLHLDAHGVGHWEADVTNPGTATIATPNSTSTDITGVTAPGDYVFHWITRYCDKTITITKQGTTAVATANSPVNYCVNQSASALTATVPSGNNLMWYTQATGGTGSTTAPTPSTATSGNTSYYVCAVDGNGCEGTRTEIVVQVEALPTASITADATICSGGTATVTFTGTPNATVTYTVDSGANQTITLDASGNATVTTPALNANSVYSLVNATAAGTLACSQAQTGSATITIAPLPTAAIAGSTSICPNSTAVISFTGTPNATITYTVDSGANQTITLDASGNATVTTPTLNTNSTYTLVSVTASGTLACSQNQTGSATVIVVPLPTAAIAGTTTICSGSTTTITFSGTPNATVTYTVDSGANQTITLDASGNASVTTPALTSDSTYSLVSVASAGTLSCSQLQTGSAIVSVISLPTATISGSTTICSGGTATISFTGTPNAVVTYTVDSGANQTVTLDATGNATVTTSALTSDSVYTLVNVALTGTASCSQAQTGSATITIAPLPTAAISGSTSVCPNSTAVISFTGTPNATITYTVDSGANQTITLDAAGNATVTTPTLNTNSTYTLVSVMASGTLACSQNQTGSATVTVVPLPTATIAGTTTICSGSTTTITFTGTPNAIVTYTVDSGANQTITLDASGNASVTTPALTSDSTYSLVSVASAGTPSCSQLQTGSAIVSVISLPTATISGSTTICSGGTATVTFTGTPNAVVTYTVDSGANQTVTLDATGNATITSPTLTSDSVYTLVNVALTGTASCSQAQTGSATITIAPLPTAAISGSTSICPNSTAVISFTGTPNATITYTVDSGANQTITLDAAGNATVTTPTLNTNSTYTLVSVTASGTLACSQNQTGSATVTVVPLPTATIAGTTTICSGSTTTITFTGTPNATVTYTVDSGANQTITLDASGNASVTTPALTSDSTYSLVSVASAGTPSCSQLQTGSAIVSVISLPTATISGSTTICSGGTATVTFTGTPNAVVTYTVDSGANQTVTLDATGNATVTTSALTSDSVYTLVNVALTGTASCSQAQTGSATITIAPLPTAAISGSTSVCPNSTAVISFTGTPNATITYTVDSGANQTITLDAAGNATVTTPTLNTDSTYTLVSVMASGTLACSQNQTGSATVTVVPLPTATIAGTTTICSGSTTTITFTGTPNATVTYTVDSGASQTITLDASGNATVTTPALTSDSTYSLVSVASAGTLSCSQSQTGSAIVSVISLPTATISGSTTICSGGTATVTFTGTPNAVVTYTVDSGANQTVTLDATGNATITTSALTSDSVYTLVNVALTGTASCSQAQTGSATITIAPLPTAAISGSTSVCPNSTAVISFTGTPNATITYTVDSGANQTITLDASGNATVTTPTLNTNSTYTLVSVTASGTLACSQNQTGSATVTVVPLPTAAIAGTTTICSGSTTTITFTGTPNATVTYTVDSGANQTITLDASGNASVTTPALTSDSTYSLVSVASAGTLSCSQLQTGSAIVSVISLPTATISGSTTICSGGTATVTFTGTPNAVVTYTVDSGANQTVTLDATGNATVTTSALSATTVYSLVNVASAGTTSCNQSLTDSATITVIALPTATISGSTSTCSGTTVTISISGTPNATVTYTVAGGANQTIVLDGTGNATITTPTLTATTTYSLVNVTSSGALSCTQTLTNNLVITVNNPTPQNLIFSYNPTCINATSNPLPILSPNFTTGGVFSSSTLTVNSITGEITLSSATIGTHQVTYTSLDDLANCTQGGTYIATITINAGVAAVVTFDYDNSYCSSATNSTPTTVSGFTTGGTFSSTSGLIINSSTGEINISQSTPGTYTITYTVATNSATCTIGGSYSDTLIISAPIAVTIESSCDEQSMILKANPVSNSFDPNTVTYTWVDGNNTVVGNNSQTLSIDDYFSDYPNAVYPLTFTVTVDASGCLGTATYTVIDNPCKLIPKGISPNDDGDNDAFDLTGLGVKEVTIFNRYGTKVYSFSGNYTNQWKGLSDNGNDLPDGTYFYNIVKDNDVTIVGWVYINR